MRTAPDFRPEPASSKADQAPGFSLKPDGLRLGIPTGFLLFALLAAFPVWAGSVPPTQGMAAAKSRLVRPSWSAYARVRPLGRSRVSALLDGTLSEFIAYPGMRLTRGEILGRLTGTEHKQETAAAKARLREARASLALALKARRSARRTYPAITDRLKLQESETAVEKARSVLAASLARWRFVQDNSLIRAPVSGVVTVLHVSDGDTVRAGEPLFEMEIPDKLWVYGIFYGPAVRLLGRGMSGTFVPLDGGPAVPVKVAGLIPAVRPDGGTGADCSIRGRSRLREGEAGTLTLRGRAKKVTVVPTSALVLQGGRWYVVLRAKDGDIHEPVEPGRRLGEWTVVRKGLRPGQHVVVKDAYLVFHKNVARAFTPPD